MASNENLVNLLFSLCLYNLTSSVHCVLPHRPSTDNYSVQRLIIELVELSFVISPDGVGTLEHQTNNKPTNYTKEQIISKAEEVYPLLIPSRLIQPWP